jgi:hypothetical protein
LRVFVKAIEGACGFGEPEQFITILELPPVDSAAAAVRVGVAYQVKKAKR